MKFLHTSDWHLGVKTNGKDRLDEQKRVLDEIINIKEEIYISSTDILRKYNEYGINM